MRGVPVEHARRPRPSGQFFDQLVEPGREGAGRGMASGVRRHTVHAAHRRHGHQPLQPCSFGVTQDALVPRAEQDALLAAIPRSRLHVYQGAGHSPNWERPEQVASDITAFMREVATT